MRKTTTKELEDADEKRLAEFGDKARLTRAEVAELMKMGRIVADPPPPSGSDDQGRPFWRNDEFRAWAGKQRLVRSSVAAPVQHRALPVDAAGGAPSSWDEATRTGLAVVASETPVTRMDWQTGKPVKEVLLASGAVLPPAGVPFLVNHAMQVESTIGRWSSPVVRGSQIEMRFEIGRGDQEDAIARKIGRGFLTGVSVGYTVLDSVYLKPGDSRSFAGHVIRNDSDINMLVVTRWSVHEISLVPVPADDTARIRSHEGTQTMPVVMPPRQVARSLQECFAIDGAPQSRDPIDRVDWYRSHPNVRATALWQAFTTPAEVYVGEGYTGAEDSTRGWIHEIDVPNFQAFEVGRVADTHLKSQPRGAAAEHSVLESTAGNLRIHRFSRQTQIDEIDIVNVESGQGRGFVSDSVFRQYGRAAKEARIDLAYSLLLSNPELLDEEELFSEAHGNDFSCTLAELDAKLSEVAAAMAAQTNGGAALNLRPDYFITASELERPVRKLVKEIDLFSGENTPTPIVRSDARIDTGVVDPVTDEKVAGAGATVIFLASGVEGYGLTAAYLEGSGRRPSLSSWPLTMGAFGIGYAVAQYVGVAVSDYRGLARIVITEE